jgi:hypothetical protein
MSALHLKRAVACAICQAPQHLERWFAEHAKGDVCVLALRAPIALPGLPDLALGRDCIIHVVRAGVPGSMIQQYLVAWESASGGPFPHFQGTLSVLNDEDYGSCFLALDGTYRPPLGLPGRAFDLAIGETIAESCGNDLLERIGTYIEQSYRGVEAAKANRRGAEAT